MKRLTALFVTLLCLAHVRADSSSVAVQDTMKHRLIIHLEYRARGQVIDGALPKPDDPAKEPGKLEYFLENRLRLRFTYQLKEWFETAVQLQGNALWGSTKSLGVSLREARVSFRAPFGLFADLGRMPLSYDDERIIGVDDWAMGALTHDLLRTGYEGHGHKLHIMLAYNHNGEILDGSNYYDASVAMPYKIMTNLWYHYEHPAFPLGVSALFMNIGMQAGIEGNQYNPAKTVYQQVIGAYAIYHPWFMTIEASGYYQCGQEADQWVQPVKLKAWMASAKADIHFDKRYGFNLGYDYLSGDDYVLVTQKGSFGMIYHEYNKGFRPIYGSRYKFLGIMDYFYESAYSNGFTPGLQNAYVGFHTTPYKGLNAAVNVHYLAAATKMQNKLGQTLGTSVDVRIGYQFNSFINLIGSYSYMHGSETMQKLKQGYGYQNVHWAWLALIVNPTIFDKKFK